MELTEKDAAIAFAKAWNRLDCIDFLKLLDDDAHYASQFVFEELENKEAISNYLIGEMQTVKASGAKVYAELGKTRSSFARRDCVFMSQDYKEKLTAVVLFEVEGNKIKRYDLCITELFNAERSGVYPI
jgi:hypothetical protein